jgi:beta-glucosidase
MVVITSAWSQKLAYKFGQSYGDDMKAVGVRGLWGWAMDNHRNSFFGRNHESPSEDAVLAGYTILNAVNGLHTRGRYCTLKHFAIYDYGNNGPTDTSYWLTEQSFREVQLRAYYKPIVIGGALGVMTTYRGIGAEISESTTALLTGVLRNEWQFKGAITTDATGAAGPCEMIIRAGGNFGMSNGLKPSSWSYDSTTSLRFQNRMREATKEILYMWLRADYYEQQYLENPDAADVFVSSTSINSWEWWRPAVTIINSTVGIGLGLWTVFLVVDIFDPDKRY